MSKQITTISAAVMVLGLWAGGVVTPAQSPLPLPACDTSRPIKQGGLTHYPSGEANLTVSRSGRLRISNLSASGRDGFCTRLPRWNGVVVNEPTPLRLRKQELLTLTYRSRQGRLASVGIRQKPGNRMSGFMDYTDDSVTATQTLTRNGEVVMSAAVGADSAFELPDMAFDGWSFHGLTGVFTVHGTDAFGDEWEFRVQPGAFQGGPLTRSSMTVATTIPGRSLADGLFGGAE